MKTGVNPNLRLKLMKKLRTKAEFKAKEAEELNAMLRLSPSFFELAIKLDIERLAQS